ncbi:diguanylate cyclase (GGDEF)-like protein/PAS domain S-box-containing protein [Pseudomonas sp. JUb42]|jgi:diguanylate cyclase (GGDEF)-like protein/PAS domain S-box-containing protein|uniref:EAL domain-containing protein n=1 Tax=Pseudomonas sp. JUb42 TaxID=2940611 RepID=UPI002169ABB6|nr:EAL domain-containing protein [Pseudomonas sp. JUb42]MCS3466851.1 diguanylate cyclase (GGDEF)-like protein/PAS domain S-box-containing protein [Pseudomonas sp. JUb42]
MKSERIFATPSLLGIVWPFIAVILFQTLLGCVSLYTLSGVRSYVAGESLWSKGQKDAIYYLSLYANSRNEADYLRYRQAMAITQGDHDFRMALEQKTPDLDAARTGILQGGNHPGDASGLIWLYLNFRNLTYMRTAIGHWQIGDEYMLRLDHLARDMHERIASNQASPADLLDWREQIVAINEGVTPAARAFSDALGEGSRAILRALLLFNLLTAIGLILLALRHTHKLLAQRRAFADALQLEKDRAQTTLQSIGDAVITTDVAGAIVYMNPAAESMTRWTHTQALGLPLAALFNLLDENDQREGATLVEHILAGKLGAGSEHFKSIQRLDGTTVAVALVGSPIRTEEGASGTVLVLHDMTRERQYIANLSWQASHDALTGLANRREFEFRLERALEYQLVEPGRHSLMFLDLDQFKLVNDTSGHAAGDELLRHICTVLQQCLSEGDTLARLGGDEFGVLLPNCSPQIAEKMAEVLRQSVQTLQFVWKGRPFVTTVSIGLVHGSPALATLEASLRAADMACYMAKEKGRNRVQVYHPDDSELSSRFGEMAWIQRLHMALEENRFILYAQAIAPLDDNPEHAGGHVEILLRLRDETGRIILPDSFIPAAERYGIMSSLDRWVVRSVFRVIAKCLREGHAGPKATCAVNLSGASVGNDEFLEFLRQQFKTFGIPPHMICFEITETVAISNLGSAIRFINELKAMGCYFALDDFCAGMSTFSYLKHLPVDYLKIDGSFVKDMLDNPINRAMVEVINHIGHVMGKRTIAEFVETPQIEAALQEIGVDFAQGYLIEKPRLFTCECLHARPARPVTRLASVPGAFG